jgi:hypothetical protein
MAMAVTCVALLEGGCSRTGLQKFLLLHCVHHHLHDVAAVSVAILALHAVGGVACSARTASYAADHPHASLRTKRLEASTYSRHIVRAHFEALAVERVAEGPQVRHAVPSTACLQPYLR